MAWDQVEAFLQEQLADGAELTKQWISQLRVCEDGERLGVCLAIELRAAAVERALIKAIVYYAVSRGPARDSRSTFGEALENHPSRADFVRATRFQSVPLEAEDQYVNIVDILKFGWWVKLTKSTLLRRAVPVRFSICYTFLGGPI